LTNVHPFNIIGEFLDGFLRAEALSAAFKLGLIDRLAQGAPASIGELAQQLALDVKHTGILSALLVNHGVLRKDVERVFLTDRFRAALAYRDLLEVRLEFGRDVRRAMHDHYAPSVRDPSRHHSQLHSIKFDARHDYPPDVRASTEQWVRFMSTYTRYSAPGLLARHDFSTHPRILDVGGNNGELAIQICRKFPAVAVTVFDIPVVCDIGTDRVRSAHLSDRISFVKGDIRVDMLPGGFDAVVFSSFLHDHGEKDIARFIRKAHDSVKSGGSVIIWETHEFDIERVGFPEYKMDLFAATTMFGPPNRYVAALDRFGFCSIQVGTDDQIGFLYTTAVREA